MNWSKDKRLTLYSQVHKSGSSTELSHPHPQELCRTPKNNIFANIMHTMFNKIATQGAPQMAVDKEANSLSRVYSYYSKFNLCLFYA